MCAVINDNQRMQEKCDGPGQGAAAGHPGTAHKLGGGGEQPQPHTVLQALMIRESNTATHGDRFRGAVTRATAAALAAAVATDVRPADARNIREMPGAVGAVSGSRMLLTLAATFLSCYVLV